MAGLGRALLIKQGSTVIAAGIRTKSVSINNEAVDITSDDDAGWRELLEEPGQKQIDISFSGITKDDTMRDLIMNGASAMLETVSIEFPDGGMLSGDFFFVSLAESGEYKGATTFDATLNSSGEITYAPVST